MSDALSKFLLQNPQTPLSNRAVAREFGVAESTVRRRRRKLRVPLPPKPTKPEPEPDLNQKLKVAGDKEGITFSGLVTKNPLDPTDTENGAFGKIFQLAGVNSEDFELVEDTFKFSTWQQSKATADGSRDLVQLYSYKGAFRRVTAGDLAAQEAAQLLALARTASAQPTNPSSPTLNPNYARIVIAGDMQIGKVDYRGGTPELLERVAQKTQALTDLMRAQPTEKAYVFDPGDLTEGFENVPSQKFLNDLSLPSMLRVGRAVLTDMVSAVASCAEETTVVTVPSNHGAWRSGKGYLGKPSDDFGLDVHHAVSEIFKHLPELNVSWVFPEEWDESVAVQVGKSKVGLVHGHQVRQGQFVNWWRGQALGSGPVADTNVCISGHYHNTLWETAGFLEGRERIHIQSPPLDNGSNWWRNLTGDQSTPGILTFLLDLDSGSIVDFRVV